MQLISLIKVNKFLLALAVILLPFNELPYLKHILREMANEGAFYPLFVAMLIWSIMLLRGDRMQLPNHISFKILILFLFWILLSGLANFSEISSIEIKGRTGREKFLFQLMLTAFVMATSLLIYDISKRLQDPLYTFRRFVMISFFIAGAYSVVEIAFFTDSDWARNILQTIHPLIRDTENIPVLQIGRLHSVSGEPSWFAIYCSLAFPWILSYVFTAPKHIWGFYLFITLYMVLLIILTYSRAVFFISAVQIILFIYGLFLMKKISVQKERIVALLFGIVVLLIISNVINHTHTYKELFSSIFKTVKLSVAEKQQEEKLQEEKLSSFTMSAIARIGSQKAAFNIALDHPIFGVGFGQYGFYMSEYVPDWAKVSSEIKAWMNPAHNTPWPPAHGIYARIAAELGFIGLAIWFLFWVSVLFSCYKQYCFNSKMTGEYDAFGLSLMVSTVGILLVGFNVDSLRFFEYWIILGLVWVYLSSSHKDVHMTTG